MADKSQARPFSTAGGLVPFPTPLELARRFAEEVAQAADADQSAIMVDGMAETDGLELEDRVPRQWLEHLNGGRPAVYRLTVPLRSGDRDLGLVRLGTSDPAGFNPVQIARARAAANRAAERLARIVGRESCPCDRRCRSRSRSSLVVLDRYRGTTAER